MKTKEEIEKALEDLRQLKKELPSHSAFGDDNHKLIDYQMDVLEGKLDDEDEIYQLQDDGEIDDAGVLINTYEWMFDRYDEGYDELFKS